MGLALLFLYRAIGAIFSLRLRNRMRDNPFAHFLMFCAIPVAVGLVLLIHPGWLKRYEERRQVLKKVEQAGGWDALRRDCLVIASQATNFERGDMGWLKYMTNFPPLPSAVSTLDPLRFTCTYDGAGSVVRFHVLGHYSTDGAWPEYWLWFYCGEGTESYVPKVNFGGGRFGVTVRMITNGIFEVTQ